MDILEEDVDEVLQEIERKYSSNQIEKEDELEELLALLSNEFETLGLPLIDTKLPHAKLIHQVASNAHLLIQLHRRTLTQITDLNMTLRSKDIKNENLDKIINDIKSHLKQTKDRNIRLENNFFNATRECTELKRNVATHNIETEKIKRYYHSKQNELSHQLNNLKNENEHLKELCGKEFGSYISTDDKFLKVLKKYKQNESNLKSRIEKLEDNNRQMLEEILNLKEELASAYSTSDKK